MTRSFAGALAFALMLASAAQADFQSELDALTKGLPKDAAGVATRIAQCHHWSGEEPYDKARAREIGRNVKKYQCDAVDRDEAKIRRRYSGEPKVLQALDAAQDF